MVAKQIAGKQTHVKSASGNWGVTCKVADGSKGDWTCAKRARGRGESPMGWWQINMGRRATKKVETIAEGGTDGLTLTTYSYTPYGSVAAEGSATQPLQWSSEYHDTELALVYYNYRHYNPMAGRWIVRDMLEVYNLYFAYKNEPARHSDYLGEEVFLIMLAIAGLVAIGLSGCSSQEEKYKDNQITDVRADVCTCVAFISPTRLDSVGMAVKDKVADYAKNTHRYHYRKIWNATCDARNGNS